MLFRPYLLNLLFVFTLLGVLNIYGHAADNGSLYNSLQFQTHFTGKLLNDFLSVFAFMINFCFITYQKFQSTATVIYLQFESNRSYTVEVTY